MPPKKGRRHALRVVRDLLASARGGRGTNLGGALDYLNRVLAHHAIIFVVSDFLGADVDRPLKLLAQRHDVVAVTVDDPAEVALPDVGLARVVDPETGESSTWIRTTPRCAPPTSASGRRTRRAAPAAAPAGHRRGGLRTEAPIIQPLLRFFRTRETRAMRR